jgi:hypothetical protein
MDSSTGDGKIWDNPQSQCREPETAMPKAIGNLTINLKSNDKISHKTKAKFGSQPAFHIDKGTPKAAEPTRKTPPKYKTRKK